MSPGTQSPTLNPNKFRLWFSRHPFLFLGAVLALGLGPFLNKAVHTDDALFVWSAEWIQRHPADFYGFQVNWWYSAIPMWVANYNPPLLSYLLAGAAALFGWNGPVLHLACLAIAILAAWGIYALARMWCHRPLLATLIAILTPAFLVSGSTLMCDVAMLGFWIWALVLWERALTSKTRGGWLFIGAGVLGGLAVLTKYSAITLLPLLPLLAILRTRRAGWWCWGFTVSLFLLAGYELITARWYGRGLFSAAVQYAHGTHINFPGGWKASGIIALAFIGGSLLPLMFFAPWLWRRSIWLAGGVIGFGGWVVLLRLGNNVVLNSGSPDLLRNRVFLVQAAGLATSASLFFLLVAAECWRRRDRETLFLGLWIAIVVYFATVLNWTVNVRSFLPLVPAAAILLVRRLDALPVSLAAEGRYGWPLAPAAAISLSLVMADCRLAGSGRAAAEQIALKYKSAGHQLWFEGHGGFQYYLEKLGGQAIDVERSRLVPGDIVVVPWIGSRVALPAGSVGWVEGMAFKPSAWMNLMGTVKNEAAGFYGANFGPVPFVIGGLPQQEYMVLRVFSGVQFNSAPANFRAMQAGDVPSYPQISFSELEATALPWTSDAMMQLQMASLVEQGKPFETALQYCRQALNQNPDNPLLLNQLAWMLATAPQPEWRNGQEAVQLANRAVAVTDRRWPPFIETLAAAYAETGQFQIAAQVSQTAYLLATLANQPDVAARIDQLTSQYLAGKTATNTQIPW